MKTTVLFLSLILSTAILEGQNCNCLNNFDFMVSKVESDYAGFQDKVTKSNRKDYLKFSRKMREMALKTQSLYRCELIMDEWLKFFNDKHLQIERTYNRYFTLKKIDTDAVLFRIPDFSWESKEMIDSLVRTNLDLITSTPLLIIDVRGNGGGIDYSYQSLLPLIYTGPYISKSVSWYASPGNIKLFEDALASGNVKKGGEEWTRNMVAQMKAHINTFVTVDRSDTVKEDTCYLLPRKVAVLVNDFCASSCEQFILSAKQSSKTLIFGTNTLGVLDYSNAVEVDMPQKNLQFRYPMTRSDRLPAYPVDNIGIEPDVRITLADDYDLQDKIDDWVLFARDYLRKELQK